jgi:pullulanase/glycogen debranching enzyme
VPLSAARASLEQSLRPSAAGHSSVEVSHETRVAVIYSDVKDLTWFRPDGREMTEADWQNPGTRAFGLRLAGDAIDEVDDRGGRIVDDTFLILLNAFWEPLPFVLLAHKPGVRWEVVLDTREAVPSGRGRPLRAGHFYDLEARSLAMFRLAGGRARRRQRPQPPPPEAPAPAPPPPASGEG